MLMGIAGDREINSSTATAPSKKRVQPLDQVDIPVLSFLRNDAGRAGNQDVAVADIQACLDVRTGPLPAEVIGILPYLDVDSVMAPFLEFVLQVLIEGHIGDVAGLNRLDGMGVRLRTVFHHGLLTVPHQVMIAPDNEIPHAMLFP